MNERHPEPTELDDATEEKIAYVMDTRGYSRADAEYEINVREGRMAQLTPREESIRQHPSSGFRRPRVRYGRPPIGEDSEDVMTGILSDEQVVANARGIALARQALSSGQSELTTAQERAIARAKRERRERNF